MEPTQATYILPVKAANADASAALAEYVNALPVAHVIVADSSPDPVFEAFGRMLDSRIDHVRCGTPVSGENGKVRNVLIALARARFDRIVVADDDVRYDAQTVQTATDALTRADVVRPQNYFEPVPWHALLDTARSLINRALDGDWPGTLAFRKSALPHGYNARVLFENYELVRTIRARGGREIVARALYVRRMPPSARHFWSQRVRQAYDEFARPLRLACALVILPATAASLAFGWWQVPVIMAFGACGLAAIGWAREGGARYFPPVAIAAAPFWLLERAICSWLAVYERLRYGGARYAGGVIRHAATPPGEFHRWAT